MYIEIEREYEKMSKLAEERYAAVQRLRLIEKDIAETSNFWIIDEYGLLEVGLRIF